MVKIDVQEDCENAPKKELLRDITIAFTKSDSNAILDQFAEDIRWEMIGDRIITGKKAAATELDEMLDESIEELTITHIITHGNAGSVNGTMKFQDGSTFGFCDVYTFTNHSKEAKIKELTSYIVELQ